MMKKGAQGKFTLTASAEVGYNFNDSFRAGVFVTASYSHNYDTDKTNYQISAGANIGYSYNGQQSNNLHIDNNIGCSYNWIWEEGQSGRNLSTKWAFSFSSSATLKTVEETTKQEEWHWMRKRWYKYGAKLKVNDKTIFPVDSKFSLLEYESNKADERHKEQNEKEKELKTYNL